MTQYKLDTSASARLKSVLWKLRFGFTPICKRGIDILFSALAVILLSPLLLLVAVVIKLDSQGPVLFKQVRVGLNGIPFTIWKFRSMYVNAEANRGNLESQNEMRTGVLFKMKKDPRITRVGSFIRKFSIDELPQLFNVLTGEMSLVGPRPPLPSEVNMYRRHDRIRLAARPGITCLWQISGRSDVPFEEQVKLDAHYIERQSMLYDLLLLVKTVPAVLSARGAY